MKKTLLYLILGAAALTFVACEKKADAKKEETKVESKLAEEAAKLEGELAKEVAKVEGKLAEEVAKIEGKVEVSKADAPNPQPVQPQDNMPQMQNAPAQAPAEKK